MELNYIILAHKNPDQLLRLVNRILAPWVRIYIHIDKQCDIDLFKKKINQNQQITFLDNRLRENGTWGDIGIVKATLNAMYNIARDGRTGYCILLSGQDYPLINNLGIQDYFSTYIGSQFITTYPLPHNILSDGGLPRINKYKINKSNKRGHFFFLPSIFEKEFYSIETAGKLNFLRKNRRFKTLSRIFFKRSFPGYINPHAGSQWWALSTDIVQNILDFLKKHPDYLKYHEYSLLPDEMFFQSILMQLQKSGNFQIKRSLTYVNWERKSGPLPVTFELNDWPELVKVSENHLFARKFDLNVDTEILKKIDQHLLR